VRYTNDIEDLGQTDHEAQEVLTKESLSQEMKEATFIHEVFHTLNTTIDHTLLDSLSTQMFQVLKDSSII
jgi:hypothetical protein